MITHPDQKKTLLPLSIFKVSKANYPQIAKSAKSYSYENHKNTRTPTRASVLLVFACLHVCVCERERVKS